MASLLQAINRISNISYRENIKVLKEFSDYVYDISKENLSHRLDMDLLRKAKYSIDTD